MRRLNSDRPALEKALAAARLHRASLVVSKVDRLTRSVAFLSRLLEAGVDVRFADLPQIEGATGRFLLQQMVAVGNRGVRPTAEMRARSTAVLKQRAATRAADIAPTIKSLLEGGATSLRAIAEGLNARGRFTSER